MSWLEYDIHTRITLQDLCKRCESHDDIVDILTDFVEPFVAEQTRQFTHWHYLIEFDKTRTEIVEICLRFEGCEENLREIKGKLLFRLQEFSEQRHLTVSDDEDEGSHEGCCGNRGQRYEGESEKYHEDWPCLMEIWQMGSESALKLLRKCSELRTDELIHLEESRILRHVRYLHFPANQLLVEHFWHAFR